LTVDTTDPARLGRWWAEVLDYRIEHEDQDETAIAPNAPDGTDHPGLTFVRVEQTKTVKNRLHIDLDPDDRDGEVERLVNMGARHVDVGHGDRAARTDPGALVLADPEGNEFCVLSGR
jgi:hypothetical protein